MSLRYGSLKIARCFLQKVDKPSAEIPVFLCPGILSSLQKPSRSIFRSSPLLSRTQERSLQQTPELKISVPTASGVLKLPLQCPGCGALSQTNHENEAGFYSLTRRSVRQRLGEEPSKKTSAEDEIVKAALQNVDEKVARTLGLEESAASSSPKSNLGEQLPICDRCHNLKHHETGVSICHPSIESIQDAIFETPYKYNHIYHVIDAADFPMSLLPELHRLFNITPQRSLNRRSKSGKFYHGRKTEVSFIITRSDLLAPLKDQVDSLMPYLTGVLRDALGRTGLDVRLGNVRCVSAVRGWWTKELKEDIWYRGGGGWMVGKVNVGKSQLFHVVFPKGRRLQEVVKKPTLAAPSGDDLLQGEPSVSNTTPEGEPEALNEPVDGLQDLEDLDPSSLLPPTIIETDYPSMPLVSSLPGTTASPIRVPFGNGKGELIDLPGLKRGDLELFVQPEHRSSLIMRSRVRPQQQVIKPGKSLLLGGFIRITPTTPDLNFLSYAFTPVDSHLTSTEKAIGTQTQTRESGLGNIALPGVGEKIASAGNFHLKWDVTKQRTGPITAKDAAGIKPENLPYRVLATDILIEGCGWVEIVAQVRKRPGEMRKAREESSDVEKLDNEPEEDEASWPAVEVFTPEGRLVASRKPMNAWLFIAKKPGEWKGKGRPRRSMKGVKKMAKKAKKVAV